MQLKKTHGAVALSVFMVIVLVVCATAYSLFAIAGKAPMSWTIFGIWLSLLTLTNGVLILLLRKKFHEFKLWTQIVILLWGGIAIWYWSLAPIYYYLSIDLNQQQLAWIAFAYFWEVPAVGGGIFISLVYLYVKGVRRYFDNGIKPKNPEKLLKTINSFSSFVATFIIFVSVVGYAIGSLQLQWFADSPAVERVKGIFNGLVISIFLGIFYYITFEELFNKVRQKFEHDYPTIYSIKKNLGVKVFWMLFATILGSLGLISLLIFGSYQRIVADNIESRLIVEQGEIQKKLQTVPIGSDLTPYLTRFAIGEHGTVSLFTQEDDEYRQLFSQEILTFISNHDSGTTFDRKKRLKSIAFYTDPVHQVKIVSIARMTDFYSNVGSFSLQLTFGAFFILILSTGVIFLTSTGTIMSIRRIASAIKNEGVETEPLHIASSDEIERLSHALIQFKNESNKLNKTLESRVQEKTSELQKALHTMKLQNINLEDTKKAVTNILEDLEEEKEKLLKTNVQGDAVFDSIGEGLIMTDVHGRIVRVNPAAITILKMKREKLIGTWVIKAIPAFSEDGGLLAADERPVVKAVETGKATSEIVWLDRSRGTRFPVQMTATLLMLQKKPIGVIIVFRDITREREIDKAKTEFVSLASHQLRTPLSSINWYTEMLIAGDVGKMNADQTSYLKEIYNGNQRMVELVNALLNVSRIELGTFMVEPEPTDLVALSKDIVKGLEPKIFERRLDVKESYGKDIPKISVDPKLMRMVIENLVSNAVKYTEKEGSVTVSIVQKEKKLLISVKDTGLGIPENQQNKIFSKLFRADNVRESDTTGTGLGLYLVRSIVEHSGGKVWFVSTEGKGTTFFVSLPMEGMKARKGSKRLDQ